MAKAPFGVLLLHGFTSHINCIDPVVPRLEKHNLPYRMPSLRGHGTKPEDLTGVKWQDWVEDGQRALDDLLTECEKVVPVALSMGSLVGMELTRNNPDKIAALVVIAPALKSKSKLSVLAPLIARVQKTYTFKEDPQGFFDPEAARTNQNYNGIPTSSVVEFLKFSAYSRNPAHLSKISAPLLILGSTQDRTIDPKIFQFMYDTVSSQSKQLTWFDKTGHEMLRDAQKEEVLDAIEAFVVKQVEVRSKKSEVRN